MKTVGVRWLMDELCSGRILGSWTLKRREDGETGRNVWRLSKVGLCVFRTSVVVWLVDWLVDLVVNWLRD